MSVLSMLEVPKLKKLAEQYKVSKEEFLAHSGGEEALKYDLTIQKVIDIIKE